MVPFLMEVCIYSFLAHLFLPLPLTPHSVLQSVSRNIDDLCAGPSSGWTGPGGEERDWWLHASTHSLSSDPHSGKAIDWSALSLFSPVDMRSCRLEEKSSQQDALHEIARRLQNRFHRSSLAQRQLEGRYKTWRKIALLQRLRSFTAASEVDVLALEARKLFDALDTDADGKISESELACWGLYGTAATDKAEQAEGSGARSTDFPPIDEMTINDLMSECDVNKEGSVCFEEIWHVLEEAHASWRKGGLKVEE